MTTSILIAGFGGQGVLFSGKFLAYCGMLAGKEVSWLPSYGPEMRGGTANCGVVLSNAAIGSPVVDKPDLLMVLNLPSLDKFEEQAVAGAKIFVDSSLVSRKVTRTDVTAIYLPATAIAENSGLKGLSNMVMIGKLLGETGLFTDKQIRDAMSKTVSERKKALFESNLKALEIGKEALFETNRNLKELETGK